MSSVNNTEQYEYILNNNSSKYLHIEDYKTNNNFHSNNQKCSKVTRELIQSKIDGYDKLSISHIPIVRDDNLKYSIYAETREDSTLIYSMCFEELFFFDFDNKQFGLEKDINLEMDDKIWNNKSTVYGKSVDIINKMTEHFKDKLDIKLYWVLYPTDNGVHAYCLSHKRNRRIQKHMNNLIDETILACADPDWIAFSYVRFGFCTRLSSKVKYIESTTQSGGYEYGITSSSDNKNLIKKNKTYKYNLNYLFDNIIYENIYKEVGDKTKILKTLKLQLDIKNHLVYYIKNLLIQYTTGIKIPIGLFSLHQCEPKENLIKKISTLYKSDKYESYCENIKGMTNCKISKLCKFVPLIDKDKFVTFMLNIKNQHNKIRYSDENKLISTSENFYDKNNNTILSKKIRNNKFKNCTKLFIDILNNPDYNDKRKKKLLNLPAGGISNSDISQLNEHPLCSYSPIMFLITRIKTFEDVEDFIKLMETKSDNNDNLLMDYIDFNYEINNKYLLTPFILILFEATKHRNNPEVYFNLIKYFIDNKLYKFTNDTLTYCLKIIISRDFSKDQKIFNFFIKALFKTESENSLLEDLLNKKKYRTLIKNIKDKLSSNNNKKILKELTNYINCINLIVQQIYLYNNVNAFNNLILKNILLELDLSNYIKNNQHFTSFLIIQQLIYEIIIKVNIFGLYYENRAYLEYFTNKNPKSLFKKHYKLFNKYINNIDNKFNLDNLFKIESKILVYVLFNFIKYNTNIKINYDNLYLYKHNNKPIILLLNYYNNEILKKIQNLKDLKEKKKFFNFILDILNNIINLENNGRQLEYNDSTFKYYISIIKLYKYLENKFIDKSPHTNKYKFKSTDKDNIDKSVLDSKKLNDINNLIIKLNKTIKTNIRSKLPRNRRFRGTISVIKNNDNSINYFATYMNTVLESSNDIDIYKYNITTGIEIDAGGPSKAFFSDLSVVISKYIKNLKKLKPDFPNLNNSNLLNNNNIKKSFNSNLNNNTISSSNIYFLGKMTARLLFIENYDLNIKLPDEIYNAILILINNPNLILDNYKVLDDKIVKNNNNNVKDVKNKSMENINKYLLLDKEDIVNIMNMDDEGFIMTFTYSGIENVNANIKNNNNNINSDKVRELIIDNSQYKEKLMNKLIMFYSEDKFINNMLTILNNSNYREFFKGFLTIYIKLIKETNNYVINDLFYLNDKNILKKSIENNKIETKDFLKNINFRFNVNNEYISRNPNNIQNRKANITKAFNQAIELIANSYDDNKKQLFFEHLLYFWTGSRSLPKQNDRNLSIDFYTNSTYRDIFENISNNSNNSRNNNTNTNRVFNQYKYRFLPNAHTCFNSIDLIIPNHNTDIKKYRLILAKMFKFAFEDGIFNSTSFGSA